MNVPYNFGTGNYTSGDQLLQKCVELNCSAVELRAQPVELFLGSPAAVAAAAGGGRRGGGAGGAARGGGASADAAGRGRGGAGGAGRGGEAPAPAGEPACVPGSGTPAVAPATEAAAGGGRGRGAATPEQQAAQAAAAEEAKKWRAGASLDKVKEFRKKWEDAGVLI